MYFESRREKERCEHGWLGGPCSAGQGSSSALGSSRSSCAHHPVRVDNISVAPYCTGRAFTCLVVLISEAIPLQQLQAHNRTESTTGCPCWSYLPCRRNYRNSRNKHGARQEIWAWLGLLSYAQQQVNTVGVEAGRMSPCLGKGASWWALRFTMLLGSFSTTFGTRRHSRPSPESYAHGCPQESRQTC